MTKSSVHKAAAKKTRSTYRKTTRKVGAGKVHSGDRTTASKVATEKARGTNRNEEFVYDAQMPESMRALAEKSVAQTRDLYARSLEAVLESWERFVVAAGQGTVA